MGIESPKCPIPHSSQESGKKEKISRPLPKRTSFWNELPSTLREGSVIHGEDKFESVDAVRVAQALTIEVIQKRLEDDFVRPELPKRKEFYSAFWTTYYDDIAEQEKKAWDSIVTEEFEDEKSKNENTPLKAAYFTIFGNNHDVEPLPSSSAELYLVFPLYARAYEELLKEKYGDSYSDEQIYAGLDASHFKKFIINKIAEDGALHDLMVMEFANSMNEEGQAILDPKSKFDPFYFELGDDDSFKVKPQAMEHFLKRAQEEERNADSSGRTINRGCPALYSGSSREIVDFAIHELIDQHKIYSNGENS